MTPYEYPKRAFSEDTVLIILNPERLEQAKENVTKTFVKMVENRMQQELSKLKEENAG